MMKTNLFCAVAVLALASCSNDSLVTDSPANTEAPIAFTVGQRNITRAVTPAANSLEGNGYYNFGVWAYKVEGSNSQNVMANYLVGYNGANGYSKAGITEGAWFYEGLGKDDYTGSTAKNKNQILRYWDKAYANTNFYAYAPYNADLTFDETNKTITVSSTAGYEKTNDVIYAGTTVESKNYGENVKLEFKHIGAKVNLAFRESVAGYKVQLINVTTDNGIELTPAIRTVDNSNYSYTTTDAKYNYTSSVEIDYTSPAAPTTSAKSSTTSSDNLKFAVPTSESGLVAYPENTTTYYVLPETENTYAVSPTTYYAVVQPTNPTTGFTLHISYKLIAEDNGEEIIVRDARVFIPETAVAWKSNTAYTYNFTITKSSTGSTGGNVDATDPTVPTNPALQPIVFDTPTIVNYDAASPVNANVNGEN